MKRKDIGKALASILKREEKNKLLETTIYFGDYGRRLHVNEADGRPKSQMRQD